MKTLLLLILALFTRQPQPQVAGIDTVVPSPAYSQIGSFAYSVIKVPNVKQLTLIPNYTASDSSKNIIANNHCLAAVNGGFYGEDSRPIGLLTIGGQTLNRRKTSDLFDGFINLGDNFSISTEPLEAKTILQSGPILMQNGNIQNLAIKSDKSSRRLLAAVSSDQIYFISVFNARAEVLGPYLADLPQIVADISQKENLGIENAINLDGGRASIFYSPSLKLSESDPVGSVFCIK